MYRILHEEHLRTGHEWCIYHLYDRAHGQSDSIERITHSLCTLEFEDHRPLYDWFIEQLGIYHPQQIEFARLNLTNTIMSKRKLIRLVEEGVVDGWDDPRMPTLSGMRRRGYTPRAIRNFCDMIGVSKANSVVDLAMLEHAIRDDLNEHAPRAFVVLDPLKIVIENYPQDKVEWFELPNHPGDESMGTRQAPFSRTLYIEREDFMEDPPPKFYRLSPGEEVRLYGAYYVTCTDVIKDEETGRVLELRCEHDPQSRGGSTPDGRRVKGTLHWVSAPHALEADVRLYEPLFLAEDPEAGGDFMDNLNPDSLQVLEGVKLEPSMAEAQAGDRYQFMRQGYFIVDGKDSTPEKPIFNQTVPLRDTWAKIRKRQKQKQKQG
jgi:glutaminyl-tRNA synthetase